MAMLADAADAVIAFVALSHVGILVLEMYYWDHPVGRKIFRMTPEQSAHSRVLAANQGLYNGFLAAGLIYGLATGSVEFKAFFLLCVVAAGLYGGLTAKRSIILTQGMPAAIGLALLAAAG
jgi:putative membrane protein